MLNSKKFLILLIIVSFALIASAQVEKTKIVNAKETSQKKSKLALNIATESEKIDPGIYDQDDEEVNVIVELENDKLLPSIFSKKEIKKFKNLRKLKISKDEIKSLEKSSEVKKVRLERRYQLTLDVAGKLIESDIVYSLGYDGSGKKVCVIDTGIDPLHPALLNKIIASKDFALDDLDSDSPLDFNGHGTHIAGIIASNDQQYMGIAPGASILNAKVFYNQGLLKPVTGPLEVMEAMDWCISQGADILTLSLGGPDSSDGADVLSQYIDSVVDKGKIVTISAGNEGPGEGTISCPGCAHKVITVGSTQTGKSGEKDSLSDFSSRGPTLDGRTKPDVVAPGEPITSTVPGSFSSKSGTSMSAPMVAGLAALLLQARPSLTPEEAKAIIMNSAFDYGIFIKDNNFGTGRINASRAISEVNFTIKNQTNSSDQVYFVYVAPQSKELRALLYWPEVYNVHNNLDLFFFKPNDEQVNTSNSQDNTDEMLKVNNPAPGFWKILIRPTSLFSTQKYAIASNLKIYNQIFGTSPGFTITSPLNNSRINKNIIDVNIFVNETIISISAILDNKNLTNFCTNCNFSSSNVFVEEGNHNLTITIISFQTDKRTIFFYVDSKAPNITLITPLDNQILIGSDISINASTNENSNCSYAMSKCNLTACNLSHLKKMNETGGYTHYQSIFNLKETIENEYYNLNISCLDNLSNLNNISRRFYVDTCIPNWVEVSTSCSLNNTIIGWFNDTNSCFIKTNSSLDNIPPANNSYLCDYYALHAPALAQILDIIVNETKNVTITLQASDPDNDSLAFSINDSRFKNISNVFKWQTNLSDGGSYTIIASASDGNFIDSQNVTITILNVADDDNNNIPDELQKIIGNSSNINSSTIFPVVEINGSTNISQDFTGTKNVKIKNNDATVLEFNLNFDNERIYFTNLTIEKQNNSNAGSLLIKGLRLQGSTKIVYVDKISNLTTLCLKDEEISSISKISSLCNGANEFGIACPDTNGRYSCTLENNKFKISGLSYSGVQQQSFCGDGIINEGESCSNCPADAGSCPPSSSSGSGGGSSGGGGGGGSGLFFVCNQQWQCANWGECVNGVSSRECNLKRVAQRTQKEQCDSLANAPETSRRCTISSLSLEKSNATEKVKSNETKIVLVQSLSQQSKANLSEITGAVVQEENVKEINVQIYVYTLLAVIITSLLAYFTIRGKTKKKR